jgi:protein-L-isoaspartate(D-aspartate) O-methyltransferase
MQNESNDLDDRQRMVDEQIAARGLQEARLLDAMRAVPRHCFVPPEYRHLAYADGPLPIGSGQTISQPYIVALMTHLLCLTGGEAVLEIGTGSGYQAAILACLARQVYTIERHEELARRAAATLNNLNIQNVSVHVGDGSLGLPEFAPYQAIVVTAAAPRLPQPLQEQVADGGHIVIPVGGHLGQYLESWQRQGTEFTREVLVPVAFVPLRGVQGWEEMEWAGY